MSKYLSPRVLKALQIAQVAAMFGIFAYAVEQVAFGGLFARGVLGIHWLYIAMFLAVLIAYFFNDNINLLYVIPIGVAYYCVHEALFNIFFISYNGFRNPFWATTTWSEEIAAVAIVTPVFIAICLKYKDRFFRSSTLARISIFLWGALTILYLVRIADGFPVSINLYNIGGVDTPSTLANEFEFATNVLFAITFYLTFAFRKESTGRKRLKAHEEVAPMLTNSRLRSERQ